MGVARVCAQEERVTRASFNNANGGFPSADLIEDSVDLGHHILPVHDDRGSFGRPQCNVEYCSVLGGIDLVAPKHGGSPVLQAGFLGQLDKELESGIGDSVLGVIKREPAAAGGQPAAAARVDGKQSAEVEVADLLIMGRESFPGRTSCQWSHG